MRNISHDAMSGTPKKFDFRLKTKKTRGTYIEYYGGEKTENFMSVPNVKILKDLLAVASLKQKVIGKNIANVNTESYQREEVVFERLLNDSINSPIKATNDKHFGATAPDDESIKNKLHIVTDQDENFVSGINNVDIDREMSDMAENSILFRFATKRISSHYKTLQEVIKGGRG